MTTEVKQTALENLVDCSYRYMSNISDCYRGTLGNRNVLCTMQGAMRLTHIVGYIVGLSHAGQSEFAERMATDLIDRIKNWLAPSDPDRYAEFEYQGETIKVPNQKCILSDDGTLHGFGLLWFRPIDPNTYYDLLATNRKDEHGEPVDYWDAEQKTKEQLQVREYVDPNARYHGELTESKYSSGACVKVYYRHTYNGGMIYHGPGQGETFTVNLGSSDKLWGVYT